MGKNCHNGLHVYASSQSCPEPSWLSVAQVLKGVHAKFAGSNCPADRPNATQSLIAEDAFLRFGHRREGFQGENITIEFILQKKGRRFACESW